MTAIFKPSLSRAAADALAQSPNLPLGATVVQNADGDYGLHWDRRLTRFESRVARGVVFQTADGGRPLPGGVRTAGQGQGQAAPTPPQAPPPLPEQAAAAPGVPRGGKGRT